MSGREFTFLGRRWFDGKEIVRFKRALMAWSVQLAATEMVTIAALNWLCGNTQTSSVPAG